MRVQKLIILTGLAAILLASGIYIKKAESAIDMQALAMVESSCNPNAVSFLGRIYGAGLWQISKIALQDYNDYHKNDYTEDQLLKVEVNRDIAEWLLFKRIPSMLKYYGHKVNDANVLQVYNLGQGKFNKGVRTQRYLDKYVKFGGKL